MRYSLFASAVLFAGALASSTAAAGGASGVTEQVSLAHDGSNAVHHAWAPSLSADGRWVTIWTRSALLPEDTNDLSDIYVRDRWTGDLVCASTSTAGDYGDGNSNHGEISADGNFVVFESFAANLCPGDTNGWSDVFLKDLTTGVLTRVSSAWGTDLAGDWDSRQPCISADGRYVAFRSSSSDLAPVPDANGLHDIYRYDRLTGDMLRVTDGLAGQTDHNSERPSISADGSRIAFESWATNLVPGDANGVRDVFWIDVGGAPVLASVRPDGTQADQFATRPSLSADGAYLVFSTWATNLGGVANALHKVYRTDLATGALELVSVDSNGVPAADSAFAGVISADGTHVAFGSEAPGLAPFQSAHWNVFLRDMDSGTTWTVGRASGTTGSADGDASSPALSADASTVAFEAYASNLVPGDGDDQWDVFVRELIPDPAPYCASSTTSAGCEPEVSCSGVPSASQANGFVIHATNVPNGRLGMLLYGLAGPAAIPFGGATMCVAGSKKRTPLMQSGGSPPAVSDCSGSYALDMNAFAVGAAGGNPHPSLVLVGQRVNAQFWGRDGAAPSGVFLSDALEYVVGP